jgi:hypothetical protein
VVYRIEDDRYVLSLQYRTSSATIHAIEQPHDYAVIVRDTDALTERLMPFATPSAFLGDPYLSDPSCRLSPTCDTIKVELSQAVYNMPSCALTTAEKHSVLKN